MTVPHLPSVVLTRSQPQATQTERWATAFLLVTVFAALAWAMYLFFGSPLGALDQEALAQLPGKFVEQLQNGPWDRLFEFCALIVVPGIHLWYSHRASKHERLHLDQMGIGYRSPLPDTLRALQPDWSLQWSQIREIRIVLPKAMFHPNLAVLEIDAGPVKRKLRPLQWSIVDSKGKTSKVTSAPWRERFLSGFRPAHDAKRTLQDIGQSSVVRYAMQAGVKVKSHTAHGIGSGFALEGHRHARVAMGLVLVLLCGAIIDLALNQEVYAVDPPFVLFAFAGALAVPAGMLWLASAGVPRKETLGLSLLLGGAFGFALYPGLLRLNAATDAKGLRAYEYRLTEYVVFTPTDSDLPALTLSKDADYWGQFKLGTMHSFELRKGALGFYQLNMTPVHAKMRAYFVGR